MSSLPAAERTTLLMTILHAPAGATPTDLAKAVNVAPDSARLKSWLQQLVDEELIFTSGSSRNLTYLAVDPDALKRDYGSAPASSPGSTAVQKPEPTENGTKPPASPPAPAVAPPPVTPEGLPPAADPDFPAMLELALPTIVSARMPRGDVIALLRDQAMKNQKTGRAMGAYVKYALAFLDTVTAAQLELYGITADEYDLWEENYTLAEPPLADRHDEPGPGQPAEGKKKEHPILPPDKPGNEPGKDGPIGAGEWDEWNPLARSPRRKPQPWYRRLSSTVLLAVLSVVSGLVYTSSSYLRNHPALSVSVLAALAVGAGGWFVVRQRGTTAPGTTKSNGERVRSDLKRSYLASIAAVLTAIAAIVATYAYLTRGPSTDALSDYLSTAVTARGGRVAVAKITTAQHTSTAWRITYEAQCVTTVPLFQRVEAMPYLRAHFATEMAEIDAAEKLNAGPSQRDGGVASPGSRLPTGGSGEGRVVSPGANNEQRITSNSGALSAAVLLTTATPAGTWSVATGQLTALYSDDAWHFTGEPLKLDGFVGERRPAGDAVFAVDAPADLARLRTLIAEQVASAAQLQAAARKLAEEREEKRQQRLASLARLLESRTLFTGTATGVGATAPLGIALEITSSVAGSSTLTAALHTAGGWTEARAYRGEWAPAAQGDGLTLTLRTTRADRLEGAGPLLDEAADRTISLDLQPNGTAIANPGGWQLQRVAPADAGPVKADFSRALTEALTATKVGLTYRGTVSAGGGAASETLVLRFTAQDPTGTRLEASLQSPRVAGWARPFRGFIFDNTFRATGTPIRLRSVESDRVPQAPTGSMLGQPKPVALNLRVEGARLIGQDGAFSYAFEPADAENEKAESGTRSQRDGGVASPGAPANSGGASTARLLPPFPDVKGAYVLTDDGQWVRLPANNGRTTRSLVQILNGFFARLKEFESQFPGVTLPPAKDITATLLFDGVDPVPAVAGHEVVVLYAGPLVMNPKLLNQHPELALEPMIEVAPLWKMDSGARMAPLVSPVAGLYSFGPIRLAATVEQPAVGFTLLRCTKDLPKRSYAVEASEGVYEFVVR